MKTKTLVIIAFIIFAFAFQASAALRSWILTKHDANGWDGLSTAAMDSIAAQYDWVDSYEGAMYNASGPDDQIDYLKSINPDVKVCLYTDNSFSDWRAGYWFHIYADSFDVNEEDCYLHFGRDGIQAQGSPVVEDKFGAANCYGAGAWFYGPAGQGVFNYDASAGSWYEYTDAAYDGTNQQFCQDVGDCLYLGQYGRFKEANFTLSSGSGGGWGGVWEYYNGSSWSSLQGVSDGTSGMTQSGKVTWTVPTESQWVNYFPDDEVYINKWVRLRCTSAGTAPSMSMVRGQDYITPSGGNYLIPGWDPANDTNNDGVWDTNNNPNATATFRWHSRVKGAWGSFKHRSNYYNKASSAFHKMFKIYMLDFISKTDASGYYGDDWPWANLWGPDIPVDYNYVSALDQFSSQEEADSAWTDWSVNLQAKALRDTLVAVNGADTIVGGNTSEIVSLPVYSQVPGAGSAMHYQSIEMYNRISVGGPLYSSVDEFLECPIQAASVGQSVLLTHYYSISRWDNEKPRWDNFTLACHYLIAGPRIYFGIVRTTTDARSLGWIKAIEYNVGQPVIPNNYADTTQHSYYIWDETDHIYARDFANALVLVRFRGTSAFDASTAQTYDLGGSYQRLLSDGTIESASNYVTLMAGDGAILIPAGTSEDVTPPAKIDDLRIE